MPYLAKIIAAGKEIRRIEIKRPGEASTESSPAPVRRLIFAEVGDTGGRLLPLDMGDEMAVGAGSAGKSPAVKEGALVGRVAVAVASPVSWRPWVPMDVILAVQEPTEPHDVLVSVRLTTVKPE
jgi:hypothetical protein